MRKVLYLDHRSLALGRVLLGLIAFWDFLRTFFVVDFFFTDDSILSRAELLGNNLEFGSFSLLFISGNAFFSYGLLFLGILSSVGLTLGIRTRFNLFVCWSILVSFQERFVYIYNGGDALLLILLFWMFFLPLSEYCSWDKSFDDEEVIEPITFNAFTIIFIGQVVTLYFFTFLKKWHPIWISEGSALYYAFALDTYIRPLGKILRNTPLEVLSLISKIIPWFEGLIPFLLFSPFKTKHLRIVVVFLFIFFHLFIEATLTVGNFSYIAIGMWTILLPSEFWEYLNKKMDDNSNQKTLIVTYDKDCGFCRRMVHTLASWLVLKNVVIQSSEKDPELHKKMMEVYSWAGQREGEDKIFFGWENFKVLLVYSKIKPIAFLLKMIPLTIGDKIYRFIANNRGSASRLVFGVGASKIVRRPSFHLQLFGGFLFALCLLYNLQKLSKPPVKLLTHELSRTLTFFRLSQNWGMFAPYPTKTEGHVEIHGQTISGEKVDLWGLINERKTRNYPSNFWRKFISRIAVEEKAEKKLRVYLGKYLCRTYNKEKPRGGNRLLALDFFYVQKTTPEPGYPPLELKRRRLFSTDCPTAANR